jgi:RNase P subunit RPR2
MKTNLNKTQAKEKIDCFFKKASFNKEEMRKIKRLAMKFKIRLKDKRRLFCKKCLSQLKGKTRISNGYKTIICGSCNYKNRYKMP